MTVNLTIDESELVEALVEPLAEGVITLIEDRIGDIATEAGSEAGSGAGSEAGAESGWDAGREAAQECANESDGEVTWGSITSRLANEFTGKSLESGCNEWRSYYDAVQWVISESMRHDEGVLHFLDEHRVGGNQYVPSPNESRVAANQQGELDQRVQNLELLVAGLAEALTASLTADSITFGPLRSYAATAAEHRWPAWMEGCVTHTL